MVTIHTKEDLIRALQEDPEWRASVRSFILTEELLALPVRFDQFVSEINQFVSEQQQFNQRVESRLGNVESRLGNVESRLGNVESKLANLDGDNLERRAVESILNIAKDHLDLTRGRVLLSRNREMDPGLRTVLDEAEAQKLVSDDEISNLEVADIIMRGRRGRDRRYIHLVAEVSRTISNNDIRRAQERARTLAATTQEETTAAVIGSTVNPPQQKLAMDLGVVIVTPAMLAEAVDSR